MERFRNIIKNNFWQAISIVIILTFIIIIALFFSYNKKTYSFKNVRENINNINYKDISKLKLINIDTKNRDSLSNLKKLELVAFITCNNCQTCIEMIVSEFNRYQLSIKSKEDNAILILLGDCENFSEDFRLRYNRVFNIYIPDSVENSQKEIIVPTPSVLFMGKNNFFLLKPNPSILLEFSKEVDELIKKYKNLK